MCAQPIRGVYPATLTPYTAGGKLNGPLLCELVEAHLATGVDGFYVGGGTGEGILQTVEERIDGVRLVTEQVAGRAQVIAHVGALTTADAVRRTSAAYVATTKSNCAAVSGSAPPGPARFGTSGELSNQPQLATSFHTTQWRRPSPRALPSVGFSHRSASRVT